MGAPITLNFSWTSAGNFPAGSNAWNGQPLALAPANTYMTPNTKPAAEEFNYILGQIATDLHNLDQTLPFWNAAIFATSGTMVVPPGTLFMHALLLGGGGAGESGSRGEVTGGTGVFPQGGGGAGAPLVSVPIGVLPGNTLGVTVGAGGVSGVINGGSGGSGSNSIIQDNTLSRVLIEAVGGSGCGCGIENKSAATNPAGYKFSPGGLYTDSLGAVAIGGMGVGGGPRPFPRSMGPVVTGGKVQHAVDQFMPSVPRAGGAVGVGDTTFFTGSISAYYSQQGQVAEMSFLSGMVGGSPGNPGTGTWGGCPGGGGGASAFGIGGAGGNGGNAGGGGVGADGAAGLPPPPGSYGSGGGGGGCGGTGSSGGAGAAGGDGAPGIVILFWMERAA